MPLSLKRHIIKNAYRRKSPLVPDNSVNLGFTKGNDTTAGEWNSSPLATDPWINESTYQAGDCMGGRWWKISKCYSILPGVKPFSLSATLLFFTSLLGLRWKVLSLPFSAQLPINFSKFQYLSKDCGVFYYSFGLRALDTLVITKRKKYLHLEDQFFKDF